MIRIVLRKMLNNPWMMICLLVGSILAVAMVSSIPTYTDGVLQRMLIKDAEEYQLQTRYYPGRYHVKETFTPITVQKTGQKLFGFLNGIFPMSLYPMLICP